MMITPLEVFQGRNFCGPVTYKAVGAYVWVVSTIRPTPKFCVEEMGVYCLDISGDSLWMVDTELHFAFLKESVGDLILNFFGRNQFSKSNFLFVMFAMN